MILTTAVQKGGTGKTTTAAAIINAADLEGKKVLCMDMDPQGSLSFAFDMKNKKNSTASVLNGSAIVDCLYPVNDNIDFVPGSWDLSTIADEKGGALKIEKALTPIKNNYDLIVIDTPPNGGILQYAAIMAADKVVIPLEADAFSLQAFGLVMDVIRQIRKANHHLKNIYVVISQYDKRSIISRQMQEAIKEQALAAGCIYLGEVRQGVAIKEAIAMQENLFTYAPKSNPAKDLMQAYQTIMEV